MQEAERWQEEFSQLHAQAEERAETAESQLKAAGFRIQQLLNQIRTWGKLQMQELCFLTTGAVLVIGVMMNSRAALLTRNLEVRNLLYSKISILPHGACYGWQMISEKQRSAEAQQGFLRDRILEPGIVNAHCGADQFELEWQGKTWSVEWHIKNGRNTHDPKRCLRIYYFWDDSSQQTVIASMPAHRHTGATSLNDESHLSCRTLF